MATMTRYEKWFAPGMEELRQRRVAELEAQLAQFARESRMPVAGQLRVWAIRNIPGEAEYFPVEQPGEGVAQTLILEDLANPFVTSNAFGMEEFDGGEWTEWYDEQGNSASDLS